VTLLFLLRVGTDYPRLRAYTRTFLPPVNTAILMDGWMRYISSVESLSASVTKQISFQRLSEKSKDSPGRRIVRVEDRSTVEDQRPRNSSPWRGEKLVGVCGVCARCVGWRKEQ